MSISHSSAVAPFHVFFSLDELPPGFGPSIVTIGNFDGVHCGHRAVIREVMERAEAQGMEPLLVTFHPHPVKVLRPQEAPLCITPLPARLELLRATGIRNVLVLPFTEAFARMDARRFAKEILCGHLRACEVHEGENFRFGYSAEGDVEQLQSLGAEMGFATRCFSPLRICGDVVSSSRIRTLIANGDVSCARRLMGHPFFVDSTPASGRGYGTRYAVPTINLAPYAELIPANGVYVTELRIGSDSQPEQVTFEGVTNVGNRPTFGEDSFAIETHLFRFQPVDLEPFTPLRLTFLRRIRNERRFESPQALLHQIRIDVARAERWFALRKVLVR